MWRRMRFVNVYGVVTGGLKMQSSSGGVVFGLANNCFIN